jgi:hypothetical protein
MNYNQHEDCGERKAKYDSNGRKDYLGKLFEKRFHGFSPSGFSAATEESGNFSATTAPRVCFCFFAMERMRFETGGGTRKIMRT